MTADAESRNKSGTILGIVVGVVVIVVFVTVVAVAAVFAAFWHCRKGKYNPNKSSVDSQDTNNSSEETNTIDSSKESDMNSSYSYNAKVSRVMQLNEEHGTKPSTPLL